MFKRMTTWSLIGALAWMGAHGMARAQTDGNTTAMPTLETRDSYMIVTHVDTRKCVFPVCGGYFVKAVNRDTTRCADGTLKNECHASWLDTSALGWTPEQQAAFEKSFGTGMAVVRGVLEPKPGGQFTADSLTITEAWQAQGTRKPLGTFYGVRNTGIVCITAPCPSLAATTLNEVKPVIHPDVVNLNYTGATDKQIQAGLEAMNTTGILVSGVVLPVRYPPLEGRPATVGKKLLASEFFVPAKP